MSFQNKQTSSLISTIAYSNLAFKIIEEWSWLKHKSLVHKLHKSNNLKLNLAAGGTPLKDWINIDMWLRSPNLKLQLPEGLHKFETDSSRYIYTSHFLEHISYPNQALFFYSRMSSHFAA